MGNIEKKEYQFVDLLKFIFCICVVALHSNAMSFLKSAEIPNEFFTLAVPFFFVTSGFFLGKKLLPAEKSEKTKIVLNYCKRLLKPFLVFSAIIVIEQFVFRLVDGDAFLTVLKEEVQHLFFYPRGALWYLAASMVGALLLLPFLRAQKLNLALVLGFFLYCFSLVCNNYYFIFENTRIEFLIDTYMNIFISARNGLFVGFLLLGIGLKCAELFMGNEEKFTKKKILPLFFGSAILYLAEMLLVLKLAGNSFREYGGYYFSLLLFVPLLLFTALILPLRISQNLSRTLRNLSVGIYLLHRPILVIVVRFGLPDLANFAITFTICLLICLLVYRLKKEPFYSLLK